MNLKRKNNCKKKLRRKEELVTLSPKEKRKKRRLKKQQEETDEVYGLSDLFENQVRYIDKHFTYVVNEVPSLLDKGLVVEISGRIVKSNPVFPKPFFSMPFNNRISCAPPNLRRYIDSDLAHPAGLNS